MLGKIRFTLDLEKSWQWLVYINLILPLLFFLLALSMGENTMGQFFSYLFTSFVHYVVNPFTDMEKFRGILGVALPTFLAVWALRRRDYKDFLITLLAESLVLVLFYFDLHLLLIGILTP